MMKAGEQLDSTGTDQDSELKQQFSKRLDRSQSAFSAWREKCKTWYRLYAGDAWDPADRAEMLAAKRQPVTFNYALSTINALIGSDQADRKEARFFGVTGDAVSESIGEWITELVRHVWRKSKGHRHESQAQLDQLLTGYGWCEEFVDASRFPFRIRPGYVPCTSMNPDPDYREDNLSDARYLIAQTIWTKDDALAKWPGKADEINRLKGAGGATNTLAPQIVRGRNYSVQEDTDARTIDDERLLVYDYQYRKREPWVAYVDPQTGKRDQKSKADFTKWLKETFAGSPIDEQTGVPIVSEVQQLEFAREVFYRAFLGGDERGGVELLEEPKRIAQDCFTYRCATGYREVQENGRTSHFGLMALVEEPQRWSAKVLSTIIEMLARNSKGGGFVKRNALVDEQKFQKDGPKPGEWTLLSEEAEPGKDIIERKPFEWPAAMDRMLDLAVNAIPEVSAVTNWIKGTAQTERSNVLISNLQGQSMVVLGPLMDPLAQFRCELGMLAARLIQVAMSDDEINTVLGDQEIEGLTHQPVTDPNTGEPVPPGPDGQPVLQPIIVTDQQGNQRPITPADIIRDTDILEYHVTVDLGDASTTAKQALWQSWTQTDLIGKLMERPNFPVEKLFPFLVRNTPGVPAEAAKRIADDIERDLMRQKMMQTLQGIEQAINQLPPDQQQQIGQDLAQLFYPQQQQGQGQQQQPQQQQNNGGAAPAQQ
jgi:hypothetical protein